MYSIISEESEQTVVAEYEFTYRQTKTYQSEAELEKAFIEQLQQQAYEYLPINNEKDLIDNLRLQLEKLNDYHFTDKEWDLFFKTKLANSNNGVEEKTAIIQEDYIQLLDRDDGSVKNIYLLDKSNIHNNSLQVINQYEVNDGTRPNRYDVTILVNGLPLVHVELKRRGVDIKEAFNQINRYSRDSFWAGCGLYDYVQLFVISNGTYTKYYSNTTRRSHVNEMNQSKIRPGKRTSNSFEFTSWWADANNKTITDLMDFTRTFFAKHTILNILTKYCVFTSEKLLLVMRPYQIVATERIIQKIIISNNYKKYGTIEGGGYVWHTTGSGKTLTSFKAAQIASKLPFIDKVLFVVDRKDLDYQTMKEYDRFEKGAADSSTNTTILAEQLGALRPDHLKNKDPKIIITTIQKLTNFIKKYKRAEVYQKHLVIIFDECHRSQFGDMHVAITKAFKKYHLFGFTGTPIFGSNASSRANPALRTTEQSFGQKLHTYTIVDAINDKNVLPFRIDYIKTMEEKENIDDEKVWDIDREKAYAAPQRISNVVSYIREHFNQKTRRNDRAFDMKVISNVKEVASAKYRQTVKEKKDTVHMNGFNSIFAVQNIPLAIEYYKEFKKQMEGLTPDKRLKVATIYSFGVNEDSPEEEGFIDDENSDDTSSLDQSSRDFLDSAICDYNEMFSTNYDTSADKFPNYYKDVSMRMKNREIDLLIVVNMFLTGFDATTLNTLWVDKNLRLHGLLQAFSRTNRILNSVKVFGNIVCFRNLEKKTNESIALFGDKEAGGIVILKTFAEYYNGYIDNDGKRYKGYREIVEEMENKYPITQPIVGEQAMKDFIKLYGTYLRARNILSSFDDFAGKELITDFDMQDYQSRYISLYNEFRKKTGHDAENVNDDIVFEMELVKQIEVNIDYILSLIRKYHADHLKDTEIKITVGKAIDSSVELRDKKELIEKFIDSLTPGSDVDTDWQEYVNEQKENELNEIITTETLRPEETHRFMENAFRDGYISESGTDIAKILPPMSRFRKDAGRSEKKGRVIETLRAFFNKFKDIISMQTE
jgi:type I restriction enzyme R subunit